jgi:hypothetical protein
VLSQNRIFSERIISSVAEDDAAEWFCLARELLLGPYLSESDAELALDLYIRSCQEMGATGGRGSVRFVGIRRAEISRHPPLEPLF